MKMNKNKLRWAIYRILVKEEKVLRPRRGGFSLAFLYDFIRYKYELYLEEVMDPLAIICEHLSYPYPVVEEEAAEA